MPYVDLDRAPRCSKQPLRLTPPRDSPRRTDRPTPPALQHNKHTGHATRVGSEARRRGAEIGMHTTHPPRQAAIASPRPDRRAHVCGARLLATCVRAGRQQQPPTRHRSIRPPPPPQCDPGNNIANRQTQTRRGSQRSSAGHVGPMGFHSRAGGLGHGKETQQRDKARIR